jgi:hypothetical protein
VDAYTEHADAAVAELLTKRPENVAAMVPWQKAWPQNVWIGTSVENSRHTFRVDALRELPAAVRFVSAEPLLGSLFLNGKPNRQPLDLADVDWGNRGRGERPEVPGSRPGLGPRPPRCVHRRPGAVLLQAARRSHVQGRWSRARRPHVG